MAFILSIETAVNGFSVAVHQDRDLLAFEYSSDPKSASEQLTSCISRLMKAAKLALAALDAIAVSAGPGSYTGLRIGMSTAKGLCFGADLPLIALNTLDVMIAGAPADFEGCLCPMIDARRMEVFCKLQSPTQVLLHSQAKVIDSESFDQFLVSNKILFFGNGAEKCSSLIQHSNAIFDSSIEAPLAKDMGSLALEKFHRNDFVDLASFEPDYGKDFYTTAKIEA